MLNMVLIKSTNLSHIRLMDLYQVMSHTSGFLAGENLAELRLDVVASEFGTTFVSFEKALKQAQKTGYTEAIIADDDLRNTIFTGFMGSVKGLVRFPDAALSTAAEQIVTVVGKYVTSIAELPQREKTAAITNMVQDLRSADHLTLLQTTGVTAWVDKLDEANRTFDELYSHRTEKEAEFVTGLVHSERIAMQQAFVKLGKAIEAYAFINGEAAYRSLADKINTEIGAVRQAVKARHTLAATAKKKSEEAQ
jgi:hypothetical protein